jgi:hypothetical protein
VTEKERAQRNLNPHKSALLAMWLWGREYSQQGGGSMDFWDRLSESRKRICRECLDRLQKAPEEKS